MPEINGINYPRLVEGVVEYGPARKVQREVANDEPEAPADQTSEGLNLNTASATALRREIDGVGPKTARDIIAAREQAPFESLADCADRVGGVALEMLEDAGAVV